MNFICEIQNNIYASGTVFVSQAGQKYCNSKKIVLASSMIRVFLTFEQSDAPVRPEKEFF